MPLQDGFILPAATRICPPPTAPALLAIAFSEAWSLPPHI
jgi:hypothetical protein